jgi:hypothetical protein
MEIHGVLVTQMELGDPRTDLRGTRIVEQGLRGAYLVRYLSRLIELGGFMVLFRTSAKLTVVMVMVVGLTAACVSSSATKDRVETSPESRRTKISELAGAYEFVSETTVQTFPEQLTTERRADQWKGFWLFQDGYFSKVMMQNERPEWTPGKFPLDPRGTGFDAGAGTFRTDGNSIELNYLLTYYPGMAYRQEVMSYEFTGNTLTLKRSFGPIRESMSKGEQITVLRRVVTTSQ